MSDAYSVLLGLAVSAAALSWLMLATSRWWPPSRTIFAAAAYAALVLDAASLVVHVFVGHRPGTPDRMTIGEFFVQHPAFLIVLLAAVVAAIVGKRIVFASSARPHE